VAPVPVPETDSSAAENDTRIPRLLNNNATSHSDPLTDRTPVFKHIAETTHVRIRLVYA
jgi:hypothetical protein